MSIDIRVAKNDKDEEVIQVLQLNHSKTIKDVLVLHTVTRYPIGTKLRISVSPGKFSCEPTEKPIRGRTSIVNIFDDQQE